MMTSSSELLLTLILNACWQIPLLAASATLIAWLLKESSARYLHWVWCAALLLALCLPLLGAVPFGLENNQPEVTTLTREVGTQQLPATLDLDRADSSSQASGALRLNQKLAVALLIIYCAIVLYRTFTLLKAALATARIRRGATPLKVTTALAPIIERCATAAGADPSATILLESNDVHLPVTFGVFRPVILLPAKLVCEPGSEIATTALGHEMVHVARRDYLFNLLFEVVYLPLSFHPAASLIRARIKQTRELSCDEIVSQRILKADAYARSLVKLASAAPPFNRLSATTTVGIADADILETRIMSLLRKPKVTSRWKKVCLTGISLVVLVMCVAAASFARRFEVAPDNASLRNASSQEQEQKEKAQRDKEQSERERTMRVRTRTPEGQARAFTDDDSELATRAEIDRRRQLEMEMSEVTHAALARLARITMEQAIQISTTQTPGKVIDCSLIGEHWEEPGKLSKDGVVLYHVVIVSGDENVPGATHVFVNAIDGSIYKVEKEMLRRMRSEQPQ